MMVDNELMTLGEVAEYLRVNKKTIYRLLDRREIPSVKVGHQWRFSKKSIDTWLYQSSSVMVTNILAIDDDPTICTLFKETLEPEGIVVTSVTSSLRGLELIKEMRFDLIFIDLKLPEMNGAELLRHIKELEPNVPVIIITGYPDSTLMDEALKSGPIAVLKKPFTSENLFSAVNTHLHRIVR